MKAHLAFLFISIFLISCATPQKAGTVQEQVAEPMTGQQSISPLNSNALDSLAVEMEDSTLDSLEDDLAEIDW